jgi:hypothetical protein
MWHDKPHLFAFPEQKSSMPVGTDAVGQAGSCPNSRRWWGIYANNFSDKPVEPVLIFA